MEAGLYALIVADEGVRCCPSEGRLYPVVLPENTKHTASTYQRISTTPLPLVDGIADYTRVRMQFDHWSREYGLAKATGDAINAVLEGFTGQLPDGTWVFDIELDSMTDSYDSNSRFYRVSVDYFVRYSRTPYQS